MSVFCLVLGLLFGFLALHPFSSFPLSLWLLRLIRRPIPLNPADAPRPLSLALCFCAFNEEAVIPKKIENLRALKAVAPSLRIYAYVDGGSDGTAALLHAVPDLVDLTWSRERLGKSHGMNQLVERVEADVIVFTDANVSLDPAGMMRLHAYFADPEVGSICGRLIYSDSDNPTASVGSFYWRLEESIKQLESDTGSVMGADGSIFAIRRALHQPVPACIIDDMFLSLSILLAGHRIVRAADVIAYEESVADTKEEFRRKIRIGCQAFNVHRLLWPRIRQTTRLNLYKYVSHKLLRWFSIYSAFLSVLFFTAWLVFRGSAWAAVFCYVAVAFMMLLGACFKLRLFAMFVNVLAALAGAGLGVVESLRGRQFQTWLPASSIRQGR